MKTGSPQGVDGRDLRWAAGIGSSLALLYWSHHARTFGAGDSPQHVLSALTWGVSRPPGYPLYTALGHAFSRLPLGSPASLVNAFSGVVHAAASAIFFLVLRRRRCGPAAALTATALMSLSSLYWYYSEVAEVRALNDLLAVGAALLCLSGNPILLGCCVGLGLSHHPSYIFILPAIAYRLKDRRLKPQFWAPFALSVAGACAAPYALLWLRLCWGRAPLYNPDDVRTARDVLDLFLRKNTGGFASFAAGLPEVRQFEPARCLREAGWFLQLAWRDLLPPGILLAVLGCHRLWKTDRKELAFWWLWVLGSLLPVVLISSQEIRFGDQDYLRAMVVRFYLLPLIGLFALAGIGADWVLSRSRKELGWALAAAAILCPLVLGSVDLSASDPLRSYAEDILRSSGPRDMILLTSDEANFSLLYMDLVERKTQDRVFLVPVLFSQKSYIERLSKRHPDLKLPRDERGLSRSLSRWMAENPDRPLEGEPTMRDTLVQVSSACFPHGVLVRLGNGFPPLQESAAQARHFLAESSAEKVPGWGLRPWTQEVYLLKAYAMILEFYGSFVRRSGDQGLAERVGRDFDAVISVR